MHVHILVCVQECFELITQHLGELLNEAIPAPNRTREIVTEDTYRSLDSIALMSCWYEQTGSDFFPIRTHQNTFFFSCSTISVWSTEKPHFLTT